MPASIPSVQGFFSRLVPPLCLTCRSAGCAADALLCPSCARALEALRPVRPLAPPAITGAWAAAPHESVARDLVAALKFRRLLPAAGAAAQLIAERAPPELLEDRAIVPVPPAPLRHAWRGFDPAGELAAALGHLVDAPLSLSLRRRGSGRQRGRGRSQRLINRPLIEARGPVPRRALLVDDVLTTGATLAACAAALRASGAVDVRAATFTHEL